MAVMTSAAFLSSLDAAFTSPSPAMGSSPARMPRMPSTDQIDTGALVSELNSYLAAYTSASAAPLALGTPLPSAASTAGGGAAGQSSSQPPNPSLDGGSTSNTDNTTSSASSLIAPPQLNEPSQHEYSEALSSLLSTLETRRANVRAHMSRLVRGMAEQLDLGPSGGSTSSSSTSAARTGGVGTGGAVSDMLTTVDDIQRGAERVLATLDSLPIQEQDVAAAQADSASQGKEDITDPAQH